MHAASRSWRSRTSARRRGNIKRNGTDRRRDDAARRGATRVRSGRPITLRFRATLPSLNVAAARIAGHVNAHQCFIDTRARARARAGLAFTRGVDPAAPLVSRRVAALSASITLFLLPPRLHCTALDRKLPRKGREEGREGGRISWLHSSLRISLGAIAPFPADPAPISAAVPR